MKKIPIELIIFLVGACAVAYMIFGAYARSQNLQSVAREHIKFQKNLPDGDPRKKSPDEIRNIEEELEKG